MVRFECEPSWLKIPASPCRPSPDSGLRAGPVAGTKKPCCASSPASIEVAGCAPRPACTRGRPPIGCARRCSISCGAAAAGQRGARSVRRQRARWASRRCRAAPRRAVFVDNDVAACAVLRDNLRALGLGGRAVVLAQRVERVLPRLLRSELVPGGAAPLQLRVRRSPVQGRAERGAGAAPLLHRPSGDAAWPGQCAGDRARPPHRAHRGPAAASIFGATATPRCRSSRRRRPRRYLPISQTRPGDPP